jgi:hypothetical protein
VNVDAVMVEASIATLKLAAIFWLNATPVAALTGSVEVTSGSVMAADAPVVNIKIKLLANDLPSRFFAIVVMVTVYTVLGASRLDGAKVAVGPVIDTVPETNDVPCIKVILAVVIVVESIASLKVMEIFWLKGTPVALFSGLVELTVGVVTTDGVTSPDLSVQPIMIMISSSGIEHSLKKFLVLFIIT